MTHDILVNNPNMDYLVHSGMVNISKRIHDIDNDLVEKAVTSKY